MYEPRVILVPTDFSDCSHKAMEIAADIAAKYGAKLYLLHIVDKIIPPTMVDCAAPDTVIQQVYNDTVQTCQNKLKDDIARLAETRGIEATFGLQTGSPHEAILEAAKKQHADLIVMGPHGKTGLTKLIVGSVTEKVLREASKPVLVVR